MPFNNVRPPLVGEPNRNLVLGLDAGHFGNGTGETPGLLVNRMPQPILIRLQHRLRHCRVGVDGFGHRL